MPVWEIVFPLTPLSYCHSPQGHEGLKFHRLLSRHKIREPLKVEHAGMTAFEKGYPS